MAVGTISPFPVAGYLDIYWKTEYTNAPIVFTIHGGGFKNGSKAYCNPDMQKLLR